MGHARALPRPLSLSTSVPQRLPWARRLAPPGPLPPQQSRHCLWEGQGQGHRLWQVTMGQGRGQGQGHRLLQAPMGQGPGPPPSPRTHPWVGSHVWLTSPGTRPGSTFSQDVRGLQTGKS
jgi:hypothetical protein